MAGLFDLNKLGERLGGYVQGALGLQEEAAALALEGCAAARCRAGKPRG